MNVYTTNEKLSEALSSFRSTKTIGFVPTMGALHQGHLSLVSQALQDNDCVVVSIFVNPTQFDNEGDLEKYPRTLDKDVALLETLQGNLIVYAPDALAFYEGDIKSRMFNFGPIANEMEGKHRKGHFDGVGTVVSRLLKIVEPHKAYFGQKDFQQLQIVKKLVEIEKIPTTIVGCEIVREPNGVAMSSRNKRLSISEFEEAILISATLKEIASKFDSLSLPALTRLAEKRFEKSNLKLEYFEIANERTLKTALRKHKTTKYRAFVAAFCGEVRLIDNMRIN